jgi:feruloyl-CoA synthase
MLEPSVVVDRREDGTIYMSSGHPIGEVPQSVAHLLAERAAQHPVRPFLRQRDAAGEWRTATYGDVLTAAEGIAQFLIDRGLGPDSAVMVLSGNSIEHALVSLGCLTARVPVVPISPAFSLSAATDVSRLMHCVETVRPAVVFAQTWDTFANAFAAIRAVVPALVVTADGSGDSMPLSELAATQPTSAVAERRDAIRPEDNSKVLFTSGSTGMPKAVPQTHGMMTAGIASLRGLRTEDPDPELVAEALEWMPWSHIAAGNINFHGIVDSGGTLYLDEGKPVPGLFDTTIRNLREISPVHFASAPIAFGILADALEGDAELRRSFFRNLRFMSYGGATLSNDIYERLQALAIAETGHRVPLTTMYGSTETQGVTMTHWATERVGLIGLPMPGVTIKLVPNGPKLEVRVKGPSVMPGYMGDGERTAAAFDEEGFYRLGDAVRFLDESDPAQGLAFDGRVTEDFKLDSGTWVSVGTLRPEVVAACSPYVQDAVIAGQDKGYVGALLWPSSTALAEFTRDGVLGTAALAGVVRDRLAAHNLGAGGSSRRIERFALMTKPLDSSIGEITDKGYINQRATLDSRAGEVDALYAPIPGAGVTLVGSAPTGGRGRDAALST